MTCDFVVASPHSPRQHSTMKNVLYDDSSSDEEGGQENDGFKVNQAYKDKFQAKKQREELSKREST
jgi:hypothetical protein